MPLKIFNEAFQILSLSLSLSLGGRTRREDHTSHLNWLIAHFSLSTSEREARNRLVSPCPLWTVEPAINQLLLKASKYIYIYICVCVCVYLFSFTVIHLKEI